jgi:phage terminase large subunit
MGLHDGINAVRAVIPICLYDAEGCAGGIKVMKNYRKTWDEGRAQFSKEPFHNWASHGADAKRTLACGYRSPDLPPDPETVKADELKRAREERLRAAGAGQNMRRGR